MGFYGWERYARIARGLAIAAGAQGHAAAVAQLGATPMWVHIRRFAVHRKMSIMLRR